MPDAARSPVPFALGVTVMPEWFACEGVDAVLDRVESLGAKAIATSPYVLEVAPDGEGGREPPIDAGAGSVRPLDRPLYGRHALWVRTAPAFEHDLSRYEGQPYQPSRATALTTRHADLIDRVIDGCGRRGIVVYLQVMAASPPGYRVQFSGARDVDECFGPDGRGHPARVDGNASLASTDVARYTATLVAELAERYPGVSGFRLDWPEYPPYDLSSALFDFNPAAQALMASRGHDPARVAREALGWLARLRNDARAALDRGDAASTFSATSWRQLFDREGPLAPLFTAKRDATTALLGTVRRALDAVPGPRRRLEPQAFPPPFSWLSGFPLDGVDGIADAVGIKLYTMHWPMIARFWAREIIGDEPRALDAMTAGIAAAFDFVDAPCDGSVLRYPEPHERHPVSARAQRDKLAMARATAGSVPAVAFAHTYGPLDDVVDRVDLCRATGMPVWLNRYGYLSDAKLAALARR